MAALQVDDTFAAKLSALARIEGRPVQEVLESMLERYQSPLESQTMIENQRASLEAIAGMFDDDIQDLSETVHDNVAAYLKKKHDGAR